MSKKTVAQQRTKVILKAIGLFVLFSAVAYGLASWAIDSGKLQAYGLGILAIIFAIRAIVIGVTSWRTVSKANG